MSYEASSTAGMSGYGGNRTITAFFDSRSDADRAVERLVAAGMSRDSIRMVAGDSGSSTKTTASSSQSGGGGFWDSLADLFMPDEDRYTYAEGLRRGGYLVTVTAGTAHYDRALDILDDDGTIDIGEREQSWRAEGWSGYSGASATGSGYGATGRSANSTGTEEVIPVAEEELRVGKRDVSHGRVRVRSYVVETPVSEQVNLREENVTVQRRSVDRPLTAGDRVFEDRTIEVEERSEEAVVAKEARVREELVVNKQVGERTETISDTVRRTEVDIEDDRGAAGTSTTGTTRSGGTGGRSGF